MTESKIELTERLRKEGRWPEASRFKEEALRKLRSDGMTKADAKDEAWRLMAENYPPRPELEPDDEDEFDDDMRDKEDQESECQPAAADQFGSPETRAWIVGEGIRCVMRAIRQWREFYYGGRRFPPDTMTEMYYQVASLLLLAAEGRLSCPEDGVGTRASLPVALAARAAGMTEAELRAALPPASECLTEADLEPTLLPEPPGTPLSGTPEAGKPAPVPSSGRD